MKEILTLRNGQRSNSRLNMDCSDAGGARMIISEKGEEREPGDRRDKGDKDGRKRAKDAPSRSERPGPWTSTPPSSR